MSTRIGTVRQFRPEDAEDCSRLVCSCLDQDGSLSESARQALVQLESPAAMRERAMLFYLAVHAGETGILGIGGVEMNEIRLVYVHPAHRRLGVGRALLGHLEALIPPALFGDVFVYALPEAAGFYRANGYRAGGEHVFTFRDVSIPTIFMTRSLSR